MFIKEKEVMMKGMENLVQALTRITSWIARITPIGTFLIIANQVGTIQLSTVKQVSTYVILYILGVSIIVFWIFPRLTTMLTSIPSLNGSSNCCRFWCLRIRRTSSSSAFPTSSSSSRKKPSFSTHRTIKRKARSRGPCLSSSICRSDRFSSPFSSFSFPHFTTSP